MSARVVHCLTAHLLRRHVADRAQHHAGLGRVPPWNVVGSVARRVPVSFAIPKSSTFTRPSLVTKMFSGLRSR